jgi:RNA polymerase sigma-70 factor, ECF subfamily
LIAVTNSFKRKPGISFMDDIDIIRSIQSGDSESFSLIVDKYHKHLLNFVCRLIGNKLIVEDIGQEVFLSVYKSIRSFDFDRGVPFSAWLFITARNRCISELRKKHQQTVSIHGTADLQAREKTPEQSACDEERRQAINAALEQLPEPFKHTILQSLSGDSLEEIAFKNKISIGTAKSRLFRAREKIKAFLNERFGGNNYGRI